MKLEWPVIEVVGEDGGVDGLEIREERSPSVRRRGKTHVMAIMLSEVDDALLEAGASETKARAAAEQVASHNSRVLRLEVMSALTLTLVVAIFVMVISLSVSPG